MPTALADAFRTELPCGAGEAETLARLARQRVPRLGGSSEDSDEDLVSRLRDPRIYGDFVESVIGGPRVTPALRIALIEHAFDLLPLPRTEGEVIAVEARAPRRLLALASSLAAAEDLSVLHVMHLVYAVFLDRSLFTEAPRRVRSAVLRAVLSEGGSGERLRLVYAGLHLAAVPEAEAYNELNRILRDHGLGRPLRHGLAALAAAEDGGRASLTRMAQEEGLLPRDLEDAEAPEVIANIPRLPDRLVRTARRFQDRRDSP